MAARTRTVSSVLQGAAAKDVRSVVDHGGVGQKGISVNKHKS